MLDALEPHHVIPAHQDLETFAKNVIKRFYGELEAIAEQHVIEGDIAEILASDPDFRRQTTKPLPDGIQHCILEKRLRSGRNPYQNQQLSLALKDLFRYSFLTIKSTVDSFHSQMATMTRFKLLNPSEKLLKQLSSNL